jgi:predicted aldo/keto reductase-like oxidoreductase
MNVLTKLGMGMMRLPQIDSEIDFETTCRMADRFLEEGGVCSTPPGATTTARASPPSGGPWWSATRANRSSWRRSCPSAGQGPEDPEKLFNEQLERTGAGYI